MTNWILFFCLLATAMGQSVVLSLLPSLGRATGLSELQVASILSLSALVFALGTTFWSRLALRLGRKRTLVIGLSGYCVGTLLFASVFYVGLLNTLETSVLYSLLLLSRILQSCIMSATPPSAMGYAISVSTPSQLLPTISRLTSANSLGQMLGPMLAGLLVIFGLLVPLYTIIIFTVIALLLVVWRLPQDKLSTTQVSAPTETTSAEAILPDETLLAATTESPEVSEKADRKYYAVSYVVIAASLFCALGMVQQSLGFFYMDNLNLSPIIAAKTVGIGSMIIAAVSLVIQFLVIQHLVLTKKVLVRLGILALVTGYSLIAINDGILMIYFGMAFIGCGMGLSYPTTSSIAIGQSHGKRQATMTGLISAAPAIGFVAGPPIAALLYLQDTYFPFYASTTLMLTMLIFSLVLSPKD